MAAEDWRQSRSVQSTLAMKADGPSIEYLAGFFDGEGCFSAEIPKGDEVIGFYMTISTTRGEEALFFKDRFGGCLHDHEGYGENHSHVFNWGATNATAKFAAERLYPHLRGKKEQCGVFIDAVEFKLANRNRSNQYPDAMIEELHEYGKRVRSFNSAQRRFAEGSE